MGIFSQKQGVMVGQVFIYIVAGIAFALIFIFGYKAISSFLISGEQVQIVQFKNDLEGSVKKIYTEYGSVRVEKYRLPESFNQICFVNMDYADDDASSEIEELKAENPYAALVWEEALNAGEEGKDGYGSVNENVFLSPAREGLSTIKIYHISIGNESDEEAEYGYVCLKIDQGTFSLILEGKGDHTKIYPHFGG